MTRKKVENIEELLDEYERLSTYGWNESEVCMDWEVIVEMQKVKAYNRIASALEKIVELDTPV